MSYDCNLTTMLDSLVRLIEFVFNFVRTQFYSCTYSMAEVRVGDHVCDAWMSFIDCSVFKVYIVIDLSISFMAIMSNFDIVLLLIFDLMISPLLK